MITISVTFLFIATLFTPSFGYRDGAREESCYNHLVDHTDDAFVLPCEPDNCRYFLIIKEVVNEATLRLGNITDSYECGKIYGIEVANDLNAPEGFLVQARNGTEDSSEIVGTFLDPDVVSQRTGGTQVNYRILQCNSSQSSTGPLLSNSATQPDTVNMAGTIQLFWQAPNCTCGLQDVRIWFTIVQQLLIVLSPSKSTTLKYVGEPSVCQETTQPSTSQPSTQPSTVPLSTQPSTVQPSTQPTTEQPTTQPSTEQLSTEQPSTEQPTTEQPSTEQPSTQPSTEQPTTEQPSTQPTTEQPSTEQPTTQPSTEQPTTQPTTEQPSTQPTTEQPSTQPSTEQPSTQPTTEQPSTEQPTTEQPSTEQPSTQPSTEQPSTQPTTEQPSTEQPSTEKPTTEQPTTQPSTEQPSTEQPSTQPTTEQPSTEQPSTQPTTEQLSTEQPSTEQPSTEQPSTEQPSTEQPSTEQPTTEQPTTPQTSEPTTSENVVCNPPCVSGVCVETNTCQCADGFTGETCDETIVGECELNPCQNGGTCTVIATSLVCSCVEGYSGEFCEITDEGSGRDDLLPLECMCSRDIECSLIGQIKNSVISPITNQLKCIIRAEPEPAVREKFEVDSSFDLQYLTPGSLSFLVSIGVLTRDVDLFSSCLLEGDTSKPFINSLGVELISITYTKPDGSFDSFDLSMSSLQELQLGSDDIMIGIGVELDDVNLCSLLTLLQHLSVPRQAQVSTCRDPNGESGNTIAFFPVTCFSTSGAE